MTSAAATAEELPGVASVRTMTQAENYARFKEIFADQPELLETADPGIMPASIEVRPTGDTDPDRLEKRLGEELPSADLRAMPCP